MALTTYFFLGALVCTASCGPVGETTVCESTPNVVSNLGLGPLALNLPSPLLMKLLSQTLVPSVAPALGSSTVCESTPNYGLPVPSQTTVCENTPNLPLPYGLNLPGYLNNLPGSTTVCESAPNAISPLPYGLPGLGLTGLGLPYPLQLGALGLPLNGLGLPLNGLGLPLNGLGLPLNGLGLPCHGRLAVSPLGLPIL